VRTPWHRTHRDERRHADAEIATRGYAAPSTCSVRLKILLDIRPYQVSRAEDYRAAEPLRTRALKRTASEGAVNVSVAVKEAPGASQSGAPVDRINGLPAGKAHDVAPVAFVRVAPDVRLSTAMSNGAPMACEEVFLTVID
jgi:hypothetical protein